MPRKRVKTSPVPVNKSDDVDDGDFFFDDSQSGSGRSSQEPQHRNAANARERARMRVLSKAFCRLKTTLPWVPADTKLSKLDTLRLASSYIAHLRALLHEPRSAHTPPHPLSLAWPFAFQHGGSLSCTISQKWNPNQSESIRNNNHTREIPNGGNETFSREFSENDFDQFDRLSASEHHDHRNQMQYCNNYSLKENYYNIRNSYSDSLVNNT